jgi:hypothetical protein
MVLPLLCSQPLVLRSHTYTRFKLIFEMVIYELSKYAGVVHILFEMQNPIIPIFIKNIFRKPDLL